MTVASTASGTGTSGGRTGYGGSGEVERAEAVRAAIAAGAPSPRIAVLGAGAGGLCMAIRLKLAGIDSFTVYEKSGGVGGTWRDNSYPGAACDVPSHLYSFSFASKADWSRRFAEQPEILAYFESLVDRFELGPHLRFGTEVTEAHFDDATGTWTLRTAGPGGEPDGTVTADVLVSGLGQLNRPHVPDIPGLDRFGGTVFHSARWDHDHDLRGERVGVIGIGASAIQFVPRVAAQARHTTLFQRSSNYVAPKKDRAFRPWERWVLEHVPGAQRAYRDSIYWRFEARFSVMRRKSRLGEYMQRAFNKQLRPMVSERLTREALIPDYPPGCKRILIADDWYPTLLQPDVDVVTDGVDHIEHDAVVTVDGERHPVDTIIFGTGFHSTEFLSPLKITGRGGRDLNEVWADGARAFLGLSVPGFPNLFILYGPNTNLGHNSILFMIEQQVGYTLRMIEEKVTAGLRSIAVRPGAADRFDAEVQTAAADTVWAADCHSWYKTEDGRITNNWTDHTTAYRKRLSDPNLSDWELEPSSRRNDATVSIRVLQWATGNVGRNAVEGILAHPDLELAGAFVYSADKVGRDVGELCGIDPVGVTAVGDVDDVIARRPDCVIYAPMLADQAEILRLLRAGIDVVTPVGWFHVGDTPAAAETQAACLQGGATLHGTGIHPGGITEQLPLVLSGFCRDVRHVRSEEFSDLRTYATEFVVRDVMLFGKVPEEAAASPMVGLLGDGFGQSIRLVAQGLGWDLDPELSTTHEMAVATAPIDTPVGVIEVGTVAAQRFEWTGTVDGVPKVSARVNWFMGEEHLDPPWDFGPEGERFEVELDAVPPVRTVFHGFQPPTLDTDLGRNEGIVATAMHCVNSVPAVVAAPPGIMTYLDLPLMPGRGI